MPVSACSLLKIHDYVIKKSSVAFNAHDVQFIGVSLGVIGA